jgi:hypothetical protein
MAGVVTVTFKTTASSEDEVRALLTRAQSELDSGYYFNEGEIAHISLVSFEETEETLTITRSELESMITAAIARDKVREANQGTDRPSGLDG